MPEEQKRARIGVIYALAAFCSWGVNPFYFKAISQVPAVEILGHRIVWSMLLSLPLVLVSRQWPQVKRALTHRKTLLTLIVTAIIVGANWLLYIHTVEVGRVLQTSLAQYINPLVNVVFGRIFLGERLTRPQMAAVGLAGAAVVNLAIASAEIPWPALGLASSFAIYGLLRKVVAVEALAGLFIETVMLFPFAMTYLILAGGSFGRVDHMTDLLLAMAGPVTFLPLLWFTSAARRLKYGMLGFLQFISPSIQFLLALFVFGEHFGPAHFVTFGVIWIAIGIFTLAPRFTREPGVT
jgi:chloramphenicol-sensitive protein RarD